MWENWVRDHGPELDSSFNWEPWFDLMISGICQECTFCAVMLAEGIRGTWDHWAESCWANPLPSSSNPSIKSCKLCLFPSFSQVLEQISEAFWSIILSEWVTIWKSVQVLGDSKETRIKLSYGTDCYCHYFGVGWRSKGQTDWLRAVITMWYLAAIHRQCLVEIDLFNGADPVLVSTSLEATVW